jgi:hypothetical protein
VTLYEVSDASAKLDHAHLLLAGSWQALLKLAPDLAYDVGRRCFIDPTQDVRCHSVLGKITNRPCHIQTPVLSAEKLRIILKAAVQRRTNINISTIPADGLSELLKQSGDTPYFLATGMTNSSTTAMLRQLRGHSLEKQMQIKSSFYSTFSLHFNPDRLPTWRVKINDLRRDSAHGLLATIFENDKALISAVSPRPLKTLHELTSFLNKIGESGLGKLLRYAELDAPTKWHRFSGSVRRWTRTVEGWPPRVFLFGDAALATDPYFGHGVFLAAAQGLALRHALTSDSSWSLQKTLEVFRRHQENLLSQCLDLQKKLGSPYQQKKIRLFQGRPALIGLHMSGELRRKFIRKIHMLDFLEEIKLSWSPPNEEKNPVSLHPSNEISLPTLERLIPEDQLQLITNEQRCCSAMERWSF